MESSSQFPSGIFMAIDWGGRRVGVALSDSTRTIARALEILHRAEGCDSLSDPEPRILTLLSDLSRVNGVSALVFGVPYYHLSGDDNPKAFLFLLAGQTIGKALGLPVFYCDEGQTSSEAREIALRRGRRASNSLAKKTFTDHLAAATLLQRFLDEDTSRAGGIDVPCTQDREQKNGKE